MTNYNYRDLRDSVVLWLEGRILGLLGDLQATGLPLLALNGVPIGSARSGPNAMKFVHVGLASPGSIAVTGMALGDNVEFVLNMTLSTDVTASFESTISVANAIAQTGSGLSTSVLLFFIQPQS